VFFELPSIEQMVPFIIAILLICGDILILKIGLTITKAEEKKNFKWVAGSFGIQFGLIFFITSLVAFILTSGSIPWLFRLIRRTSKYLRK